MEIGWIYWFHATKSDQTEILERGRAAAMSYFTRFFALHHKSTSIGVKDFLQQTKLFAQIPKKRSPF